ncbi:uncharacterized protein L969DRAFT_53956 [Mixia osmundae IAM 14324]|uniref:Anaphase-promoting complex subunit 4 WD40 domain-containing protein n=1 Tax=Mixia osmundae (strain CBS 9802 / IAM 14324 / JCM 22182 / KY 12970) TaxID=764103 RepID=G7E286_MIXOS|nr:uncharacterized protein L969DRAFT_53956 [Mixia osmundae IAM 14324]KEI36819.1 hypothetical protein L969DRAFT_53956 [Mixia osmundae IAM 14324]GAA96946.1 hypothetical protein E5Q_03620 [Mixia osmundae IAM 14324]
MDELATISCSRPGRLLARRHSLRARDDLIERFDRLQVLGLQRDGPNALHAHGRFSRLDQPGHGGCVNTLSWSQDGQRLLSGSDDTRLCLWKLGRRPDLPYSLGLERVIETGHSANIFSAKFLPHSANAGLVSAAGDGEIRCFDLNKGSGSVRHMNNSGNTWDIYSAPTPACTRILRCHRDRVKRVALEDSAHLFLTCSEDGTVRQHDLRIPHLCLPRDQYQCPDPLVDYSSHYMSLYTLTTSPLRPELMVVGGSSPFVYLHDRRMLRNANNHWGLASKPGRITQCVRRFGLPATLASPAELERSEVYTAEGDNHVTAAKLSEYNARDLLVSYSNAKADGVYLFDVFGETHEESQALRSHRRSSAKPKVPAKRKRPPQVNLPSETDSHNSEIVTLADDEPSFDIHDDGGLYEDAGSEDIEPDSSSDMELSSGQSEQSSNSDTGTARARQHQAMLNRQKRERSLEGDVPIVLPVRQYKGARNQETVKDVNFDSTGSHVVSGSDDSHVFIWNLQTARIETILKGDSEITNVIQFNRIYPLMAASGLDNTIKIFGPVDEPASEHVRTAQAAEILQRNARQGGRERGMRAFSAADMVAFLSGMQGDAEGSDAEEGDGARRQVTIPLAALRERFQEEGNTECVIV